MSAGREAPSGYDEIAQRLGLWYLTYLGRDGEVGSAGRKILRGLLESTGTGCPPDRVGIEIERGLLATLGSFGLAGRDDEGRCWALVPEIFDRSLWQLLGLAALDLATGVPDRSASEILFEELERRTDGRGKSFAEVPFGTIDPAYSDDELEALADAGDTIEAILSARRLALREPGPNGGEYAELALFAQPVPDRRDRRRQDRTRGDERGGKR